MNKKAKINDRKKYKESTTWKVISLLSFTLMPWVMVHSCNLNTPEAEDGGWRIWGRPGLHEFQASLDQIVRFCLRKEKVHVEEPHRINKEESVQIQRKPYHRWGLRVFAKDNFMLITLKADAKEKFLENTVHQKSLRENKQNLNNLITIKGIWYWKFIFT
jgi:hypothetical protein